MAAGLPSMDGIRQRLTRLPIFNRLLIGNSLVIILGAVGGTLLTRQLAVQHEVWLIAVFASMGILLSLLVNYWILRSALRPLEVLRGIVDHVQAGQAGVSLPEVRDADRDTQRLAAAIQSMLTRLDERTRQLRALSERAIHAQEAERKRIAQNLHDETGQALSTLIINLERIEVALPPTAADLQPRLSDTRQLATRTLDDLRNLIYGLRPTILDDLGLVPAIRWYARSSFGEAGVHLQLDSLDEATRMPAEIETTLFRIAQEAVNNIVRHAQARTVSVLLRREGEDVCLTVEDDGQGFDVNRTSAIALPQRRLGLLGIQERVEMVGGRMKVESQPGRGTRLHVRVPVATGAVDE